MFDGEKLKKYMNEHGITNAALARELGVSEGAVRHIIIGLKQPSLYMACVLAKKMNCAVDDLIKSL